MTIPEESLNKAYIGIGSNLEQPQKQVMKAIKNLHKLVQSKVIHVSSMYRTAPLGLTEQPDFINAVVEIDTHLSSADLLHELFLIEQQFGRKREFPNGPRVIDFDILLYGEFITHTPVLTIPHPRMHLRAFVLFPLAEIAPQIVIPGQGDIQQCLALCADQTIEKIIPSKEKLTATV